MNFPSAYPLLADLVLLLHFAVVLFVVGGLLLGLIEAFGAGYISSVYKDGFSFIAILVVLFVMPRGLFGAKVTDRV